MLKRDRDYSIILAAIATFIYFMFGATWSEAGYKNMNIYAAGLFVWILSYLLFYAALFFINKKTNILEKKVLDVVIAIIVMVLGVIWMCGAYNAEVYVLDTGNDNVPVWFLRHHMSHLLYIILLAVFSILFFVLIKNSKSVAKSKTVRWLVIVINAFLQGLIIYTPNFYEDTYGQVYHIDAYCNSIINCLRGVPYDETTFSVYGHYGILYIIPVRVIKLLTRNEWISIAIVIAIIGFIAFVLQGIIVDKLVNNDVIFVLALAASSLPSFQSYAGAYFQVYPHRLFFPAIIMWACIRASEGISGKKEKYVIWGVCGLAVLWNFETGVICLVGWFLCNLYLDMVERGKYSALIFGKNILFAVSAFIFSYFIFCVYNKVHGGAFQNLDIYIHMVPNALISDGLQLSLPTSYNGYFLTIALLMGVISYYLVDIFRLKLEKKKLVVIIISIMGIGLFAYYINRAVYENKSIIAFIFMAVLAYVCEKFTELGNGICVKETSKENLYGLKDFSVRAVCYCGLILVLVSAFFSLVASVGNAIDTKTTSSLEMDSIDKLADELDCLLPENAVAYAYGSPELFSYMNRDTGIYTTDLPDLTYASGLDGLGYVKLYNDLNENKYEYLLVSLGEYVIIPEGYQEIYANTTVTSAIKVYHYGELPDSYQLIYNYLHFMGDKDYNFDDIINRCSNIDSDDDFVDELWKIGEEKGYLSEDMDNVSFVCFLYESIVGRKISDEELEMFNEYLDSGVTKKEAFKVFIRQDGIQEDARRIAVGE